MSVTKLPPREPPHRRRHDVALWAGISSFFGSLLALGVVNLVNPDDWIKLVAALPVALITAGGVYAKERLDEAKQEREQEDKFSG